MSRSYKKIHGCKDCHTYAKKLHNRKIRRNWKQNNYDKEINVDIKDVKNEYLPNDFKWKDCTINEFGFDVSLHELKTPTQGSNKSCSHKKCGIDKYDITDWTYFHYSELDLRLTLEQDYYTSDRKYWLFKQDVEHLSKKQFVNKVMKRLKTK